MSNEEENLFDFPCEFPLKVMGRDEAAFESQVMAIVSQHIEMTEILSCECRPSKKGNFVSVTVTIQAQSKQQLDNLYIELNASEVVLMTL